jgi:tRNA-uridine 2-sulfurtransferase
MLREFLMKALSLFSGGLDSILAVKLIERQGIDVKGIFLETPFFSSKKALTYSEYSGLPLKVIDITDDYIDMLLKPKYGYGKGLNPCIDCHIFMLRVVGSMLQQEGASFIVSGEVLGQRPMSQNLRSLMTISKESGFSDLIIRPLSAQRLHESLPEKTGWVKRGELPGFSGRSRRPQIELAGRLGIKNYPAPAGGCLLTDRAFSRRLRDLISASAVLERRDIELLKWGRHFRIEKETKLIVGRNKRENEIISSLAVKNDIVLTDDSYPGPTVLASKNISADGLRLATSIAASYSNAPPNYPVALKMLRGSKTHRIVGYGKERGYFSQFMI